MGGEGGGQEGQIAVLQRERGALEKWMREWEGAEEKGDGEGEGCRARERG